MLKARAIQTIRLILVFLLLVAPFEVLFANTPHTDAHGASVNVVQMNDHSADEISLHKHHTENVDNTASTSSDCEKKCAHCVFCSAAVFSPVYSNNNSLSVFNPHINNYVSGVIADLHIQPPISI